MLQTLKKLITPKDEGEDSFRVRTVITKSGRKIYFAEHKPKGFYQVWSAIILVNNAVYRTISDPTLNDPELSVTSPEEAKKYCLEYQKKLIIERGDEVVGQELELITL